MQERKVCVIEGIIGAGKTTLIEFLLRKFTQDNLNFCLVKEPVDKWIQNGSLDRFYKNPGRKAYQFQTMAFHDRILEIISVFEKNPTADIFILERSVYSDILFMKTLLELKTIENDEYEDYKKLWVMWQNLIPPTLKPTHFIYLKLPVEEAMKRLRERSRSEEVGVKTLYQEKLSFFHDEMFNNEIVVLGSETKPKKLVIDVSKDYRDGPQIIVNQIVDFLA